jgi:hypothetical protein
MASPVISVAANIQSNGVLLRRVIGNLIRNALEASNPGDTVTSPSKTTVLLNSQYITNPCCPKMSDCSFFSVPLAPRKAKAEELAHIA